MLKAKAGRTLTVERGAMHACDKYTGAVCCTVHHLLRSWVERSGLSPSVGRSFLVKLKQPCAESLWLTLGVDVNLVELRCPQYKGSLNCPGRVSLNTVFARMEEFIGYL